MKKKTMFWTMPLVLIVCIVVLICALKNSNENRECPINANNVANLDTERVIEMIVKAEKLDESSQLCVNGDNFDLMFTTDFKWANDGAILFFYTRKQKIYSAQLRMFHDENMYFITDSSEWIEQG